MANKFTKLNIGEAVASSGSRVLKKLIVESVTPDDAVNIILADKDGQIIADKDGYILTVK